MFGEDLKYIRWDDVSLPTEVDQLIIDTRMQVCKICEDLNEFNTCIHCGCFMPMKIRLRGSEIKCPVGKW